MMSHAPVIYPNKVGVPAADPRCEAMSAERVEVLLKLLTEVLAVIHDDSERASTRLSQAIDLLEPAAPLLPQQARRIGGLAGWQIQRLDRYIHQHLDNPIRTPQLAGSLNLSVSHFSHAFKQTLGIAPLVYVARRRIESAQQVMLATNLSLIEIALSHGFCDQSHFSRTFRRETGLTPQMWRRIFCQSEMKTGLLSSDRATGIPTIKFGSDTEKAPA